MALDEDPDFATAVLGRSLRFRGAGQILRAFVKGVQLGCAGAAMASAAKILSAIAAASRPRLGLRARTGRQGRQGRAWICTTTLARVQPGRDFTLTWREASATAAEVDHVLDAYENILVVGTPCRIENRKVGSVVALQARVAVALEQGQAPARVESFMRDYYSSRGNRIFGRAVGFAKPRQEDVEAGGRSRIGEHFVRWSGSSSRVRSLRRGRRPALITPLFPRPTAATRAGERPSAAPSALVDRRPIPQRSRERPRLEILSGATACPRAHGHASAR